MTKTTVSAHTSQETIDRLDQIAQAERRNRSQVIGMAIDFYIELPPVAREAWLKITSTGSTKQIQMFMEKIAQVAVKTQYQIMPDRTIPEITTDHPEPSTEEDDILEKW
jgi:predicted transcriptional regulator